MIPKIVFIVPYRNRSSHKFFFSKYMTSLLENDSYEIYFSHQCDDRPFNRGAVKNIGFLATKKKYPNDYLDITFVFNDIDTIPFTKLFDYETEKEKVKHFYGFKYALGGIVAIKGSDFEMINGYPNFWGWGMEDAILQKRCEQHNIIIDRTTFYPIGSPEILHLFDGVSRIINKNESLSKKDNNMDGIKSLYKIFFTIDSESLNPLDNIHIIQNNKIHIINITTFSCLTKIENEEFFNYDLREPYKKLLNSTRVKSSEFVSNDWTNIPFYPTVEKKKEMIKMYGKEQTEKIIEDGLNKSNKNIKTSNSNINKFSPFYAKYVGAKPPATCSAKIGLGGVKK